MKAEEAKKLADGYRQTMKPILDLIVSRAKLGYYFINLTNVMYDYDQKAQDDMLDRLRKLGYHVKDNGMDLIVRWGKIEEEVARENQIREQENQRQAELEEQLREQEELIKHQKITITDLEGTVTSQVKAINKQQEQTQQLRKQDAVIKQLQNKIKTLEEQVPNQEPIK